MSTRVLVVGLIPENEQQLDYMIAYLLRKDLDYLAERLADGEFEAYDMSTLPENGDAIDAIDGDVLAVFAFHLYGIGGGCPPSLDHDYYYNRNNEDLLAVCRANGAILFAWGDQPDDWAGDRGHGFSPAAMYE